MIKITKEELNQMIQEAVNKKLSMLKESRDFTARRKIIHSAQNASMEFENEIKSLLNLVEPDEMQAQLQTRYFEIAEEMKGKIVKAVAEAVGNFAKLPRNDSGERKGQQ